MKNFFKNGFSIDETRVSALILSFLIFLIPSAIVYYKYHIITEECKMVIGYFIAGISSINVFKSVFPNKTENPSEEN